MINVVSYKTFVYKKKTIKKLIIIVKNVNYNIYKTNEI